jgi:hypothetical protein
MHARTVVRVVAVALTLGACSSSSTRATSTTTVAAKAAVPSIAWSAMRNPVLGEPGHAVKDAAIVWAGDRWHALFSDVGTTGGWRIGMSSSADLHRWSPITTMPHDPAVEGEASPDVQRVPGGGFVVTYQSFVHDRGSALAKLYYRTTADFVSFSAPHPLGRNLHPAATDRMIDAAVAYTPAGLLLGYKVGTDAQAFEVARSDSGTLDGPWTLIGRPDIRVYGDTIENYQFLRLDGRWRLLATSNILDRPFLFDLAGDPRTPTGWLHWSAGRELVVPREAWDRTPGITGTTIEHGNCAYVVDAAPVGGYTYVVYEDSPNKSTISGEGPGRLGIVRSRDLLHWSAPPS